MRISKKVKAILDNYSSDSPGVKSNLVKILMHGKLKAILLKCHDKVLGFTFLFPYQNINVFKNCPHV